MRFSILPSPRATRIGLILPLLLLAACDSSDRLQYKGALAPVRNGGDQAMSAAAIKASLVGNSVVASAATGRWLGYFAPDGNFRCFAFSKQPIPQVNPSAPPLNRALRELANDLGGASANDPKTEERWTFLRGSWEIRSDRMCVRMETQKEADCFHLVQQPAGVHAYNLGGAEWRFSANLRPGNPFGL